MKMRQEVAEEVLGRMRERYARRGRKGNRCGLPSYPSARDGALPQLAAACGVSPRTLLRRFRTALGRSPGEYLQELRIEKAKDLLERSDRTVEEIVAAVGYDDSRSFRRLFRRRMGISPKRYRRRHTLFPAGRKEEAAVPDTRCCEAPA